MYSAARRQHRFGGFRTDDTPSSFASYRDDSDVDGEAEEVEESVMHDSSFDEEELDEDFSEEDDDEEDQEIESDHTDGPSESDEAYRPGRTRRKRVSPKKKTSLSRAYSGKDDLGSRKSTRKRRTIEYDVDEDEDEFNERIGDSDDYEGGEKVKDEDEDGNSLKRTRPTSKKIKKKIKKKSPKSVKSRDGGNAPKKRKVADSNESKTCLLTSEEIKKLKEEGWGEAVWLQESYQTYGSYRPQVYVFYKKYLNSILRTLYFSWDRVDRLAIV